MLKREIHLFAGGGGDRPLVCLRQMASLPGRHPLRNNSQYAWPAAPNLEKLTKRKFARFSRFSCSHGDQQYVLPTPRSGLISVQRLLPGAAAEHDKKCCCTAWLGVCQGQAMCSAGACLFMSFARQRRVTKLCKWRNQNV